MNQLSGSILEIKTDKHLSLVTILVSDVTFKSIVIDTPETAEYLRTGKSVQVLFKETEVNIGVGHSLKVSMQNRIPGVIVELKQGALLSKVAVGSSLGQIESIITSKAVEELGLGVGKEVVALIKTNEIMLSD